ncbi:CotH kinase family protein [Collinsella aerofaciens]|uniref:CotH kinase family protein n=1 Tax=Collinsella aerofaciens TaxID=74426 RepID=UPI0034A1A4F1
MTDRMISRRRLIEAAAGTLLLSGCSSQDESSTKKTKKQDKIKKADASSEIKHLRDKDELYEVYDDSGIVCMYLTVSRGNSSENTDHSWTEINTYSVYDYADMGVTRYQVMGLLQPGDDKGPVAGEVGYGEEAPNATVQVRGQTSSTYTQKNYKVELKKGKGTWRQQRAIALNKHIGEGMRFRNKMAYDLIRGIPQMMGLRTQFVHLWVCDQTEKSNDTFEDYGLFTQVEQLNKTALKAHGLDKSGHLYKVNSFDFHRFEDTIKLTDDPDYNQTAFEGMLEIKGDSDHTKLIEMLHALNDDTQKIDDVLDTYFDTENLVYWMAFQILTGNCDTQNRNCYLYSPLNSKVWYILDWDNDGMLRKFELSLTGFSDYASWERGVSNYWGNVLFNRALRSKSFRSELDSAVKDLRSYLTEERLSKMVEHYR